MRRVVEYRRLAEECRRLAAALTKPSDRHALELMARGWDRRADEREGKLCGGDDLVEATPAPLFSEPVA